MAEILLKTLAEVRKQLDSSLQMHKHLCDIRAVRDFQDAVVAELGSCDPEMARRIIERLTKRQAACQ